MSAQSEQMQSRLAAIRDRIAAACRRVGRDPDEVELLPVSKTQPVSALLTARDAGCYRFGENRVQEMVAKLGELGPDPGLEFVIIGHLQQNKAGKVAELAAGFQALDSLELARTLERRLQACGRRLDVLVEVNTSGEATKFGLAPEKVPGFCAELAAFDALRPRGLMTIAAPGPDSQRIAGCFGVLRDLRTRLRDAQTAGSEWAELSMGMSADFELAIEYGATCVRVGTAIFGPRPPRAATRQ